MLQVMNIITSRDCPGCSYCAKVNVSPRPCSGKGNLYRNENISCSLVTESLDPVALNLGVGEVLAYI